MKAQDVLSRRVSCSPAPTPASRLWWAQDMGMGHGAWGMEWHGMVQHSTALDMT